MAEISRSLQYLGESVRQIPASIGKSKREEALFRLQGAKFDYQIAKDRRTEGRAGERHDIFMDKARAEQEARNTPFSMANLMNAEGFTTQEKARVAKDWPETLRIATGRNDLQYDSGTGHIIGPENYVMSDWEAKQKLLPRSAELYALKTNPRKQLDIDAEKEGPEGDTARQTLAEITQPGIKGDKAMLEFLQAAEGRLAEKWAGAHEWIPRDMTKAIRAEGIGQVQAEIKALKTKMREDAKSKVAFERKQTLAEAAAGRRPTDEQKSRRKIADAQISDIFKMMRKGDPNTGDPYTDQEIKDFKARINDWRKWRRGETATKPGAFDSDDPLGILGNAPAVLQPGKTAGGGELLKGTIPQR